VSKLDYIIVGQGITGTCLALMLIQKGKSVKLIDNHHRYSSTKIAAGIINPVTGRKYVKSWMIDILLPFAKAFYQNVEHTFDLKLVYETEIKRNMPSITAVNDWMARCQDPVYDAYVKEVKQEQSLSKSVFSKYGFSTIKNVLRVDISKLIQEFRQNCLENSLLLEEEFEYLDLTHTNGIEYRGLEANTLIFCEGYRSIYNPYFRNLPFVPLKGEVITLEIPSLKLENILRHDRFLVPLGQDKYWTGGGYERENIDQEPTKEYLQELKKDLDDFLKCDYKILSHKAAVRPAVKDRKPILGEHPDYRNIYICNGMGTKGASLAPYFCNHLLEHIEEDAELMPEVDIKRFVNTSHGR